MTKEMTFTFAQSETQGTMGDVVAFGTGYDSGLDMEAGSDGDGLFSLFGEPVGREMETLDLDIVAF